jgi:hypothetical protein
LESYLLVPEADFHPELQSPWLLRIELDKMMMLDKRLECAEVASKIGGAYDGLVHVINSEDNAEKLVLRLRLVDGVYSNGLEPCTNTGLRPAFTSFANKSVEISASNSVENKRKKNSTAPRFSSQ